MRSSQDTYTLANGVNMPCIGLGTYQSPDAVASAAVKDAMAAGYRLIDTAAAYGHPHQRRSPRGNFCDQQAAQRRARLSGDA